MPKQKNEVRVTIVPYEEEVKERIYSNYVIVRHSPFDFSLEFCEIPPANERQIKEIDRTKQVKAEVKAKIALPTKLIPSLIDALVDNYKKYEKKFEKK